MDKINILKHLRSAQSYLLVLIAISMPFNLEQFNFNGLFITLFAVVSFLILLMWPPNKDYFLKFVLPFLILFFLYVIGALLSNNKTEAWQVLERKLSLVVFPIGLLMTFQPSMMNYKMILKSFVVSCTFLSALAIISSFYYYSKTNNTDLFYYHDLSKQIGMHAAYLSMYLVFSLALLLFYIQNQIVSKSAYLLLFLSATIQIFVLVLLSSRMQIILMVIVLIGFIINHFKLYKSKLKMLGISLLTLIIAFSFILLSPRVRERFKAAINYNNEFSMSKKWGEQQMRTLIWKSAFSLIKEKPLFGYGTGDVQDELEKTYINNEYVSLTYFPNTRFNAHNQFLEICLSIGVFGFSILLIGLTNYIRQSFQTKNLLYIIFLLVFIFSSLTESILERQNGIVFFSFFNALLFLNPDKKRH